MKIESVVEGVFKQLKEHGLSEYTLQQNMWSYYRAIIKFHTASGTDEYTFSLIRIMVRFLPVGQGISLTELG